MKTTFKKVFDDFEDDIMNIDESSICEDIDINIDDIKKNVFARLETENLKKPSGKRITRRFTVALVAAVLLVSMAIVTIYASSNASLVFREFFNGSLNSAGLYDGKDITVTSSDPALNVELLGVTGDERRVYAVLEVTKKDGSTITDEGYEYPFLWENEHKSLWEHYECYASYTDKEGNYFGPTSDLITYSLSDDRKNLKMMFSVSAQNKDLQDATLTITSKSFGARKVVNSLATKDNLTDEYDNNTIKKLQQELGIEDEECTQIYNGECYEYVYADSKKYELPFKISFKINIGDNNNIEKLLTVKNAPNFVDNVADKVTMEITSFGINICCKRDLEVYEQTSKGDEEICYKPLDDENCKIIMNDGTEYYLYIYTDGCTKGVVQEGNDYYYEENIILNFSPASGTPLEAEINLIDTREIKTIILNGDIVYGE